MKKLFSAIMVVLSISTATYAQTDAKAKAILAEVSKKYKSYTVIKTDFTFTLENQKAGVKDVQQGTLFAKASSNKYKVLMTNQDLYSDGKSNWTYLKKDKEVQVSAVDNSGDALNPAQIFTMYEKGFKYIYTGEQKVGGKTYQMIDLSPTDTKKAIFKVRLSVDKAAKQISNAVLFDKNGSKYTYKVKNFVPNVKVADSDFAFDTKKFPGVEVVDLR